MKNLEKGLSLLEVLVSIGILAIISVITVSILTNSFKGGNKTTLTGNIKQNGQNALNIMDQTIRNSSTVICPYVSGTSNEITVDTINGKKIRFRYIQSTNSINGSIVQEEVDLITSTSVKDVICNPNNITIVPQTTISLTDPGTSSGVSITLPPSNHIFTLNRLDGTKDTVKIEFDLKPAVNAPKGFENTLGGTGTYHFATTVQLR